ncbi:putative membrane protein [Tumebacillus sp. BK434]|uniref:YhgE/Pip family protein n=1 Tax=Tumebacillus sp. BK434 TaxID=2512169 RepID=UPI0010E28553|nr:YhgE/Pip domain-containing protein [Tumebacillus sp. BK434]TCP53787.1 putative membrane protein [Tumebacillus sp. BK434]
MNVFWIFRTEFRRLLRSRIGRAAVVVGMIIPLLYSGLYLYAFWDPYKQLDQFPVAIVNQDRGEYGQDLVDELLKDRKFGFEVVDAKTAQAGLEGDRYYLTMTIPPTFSDDVRSVEGDDPHRAKLQFTPNEGKNYIASTITSRLESELRETLGNKFSEEYFKGIFDVIGDAGNGISKAADGANKLASGAADLATGNRDLANGTKEVDSGTHQVADGNAKLADGANKIAAGINDAYSGSAAVAEGAKKLADGSGQLIAGLDKASAGVNQVQAGLQASLPKTEQLQAGLAQMQGTLGTAAGQPSSADPRQWTVQQSLAYLGKQYGMEQDPAYQVALGKVAAVANGLGDSAGGVESSKAGLQQAVGALQQIAAGQQALRDGAQGLAAGGNDLSQGAGQLNTGLGALKTGSATLASSSAELAAGSGKVAAGSSQLVSGSTKLADGAKELADGNKTLADELTRATSESTIKNPDQKAAIMADPLETQWQPVHEVATYGMGFASYFIPLSLWVGALMLYFILSMQEYRWTLSPVSTPSLVLGKYSTLAVIGVVQAVIVSFFLTQVLGLKVLHLTEFYLFNILISLTSIAIIGLLIARLGSGAGRFFAILLLILQLTSSGGTFPIELVPQFFQTLHHFLPMTYGVEGLRSIISTGDQTQVIRDLSILGGILISVLLVHILTTRRTLRVRDLHDKDQLAG